MLAAVAVVAAFTHAACVAERGPGPCAQGRELAGATGIAASSDGRNVYTASFKTGAVAAFARRPDGTLRQLRGRAGCLSRLGREGCDPQSGLWGSTTLTVSPDGRNVYVASLFSDQITVLRRSRRTGRLSALHGPDRCISASGTRGCRRDRALFGVTQVAVSPDGRDAYAIADTTIVEFRRDPRSGALRLLPGRHGCVAASSRAGCTRVPGLGLPDQIVVRPDGRAVYVASEEPDRLLVLVRGRSGALRAGAGRAVPGVSGVAVSSDGRNAYVAATAHLVVFRIAGRTGLRRVALVTAAADPYDVAVSPDGRRVYTTDASRSPAVLAFDRDPATGEPVAAGCVVRLPRSGCQAVPALDAPRYIAVVAGTVYVASAQAVPGRTSGAVVVLGA